MSAKPRLGKRNSLFVCSRVDFYTNAAEFEPSRNGPPARSAAAEFVISDVHLTIVLCSSDTQAATLSQEQPRETPVPVTGAGNVQASMRLQDRLAIGGLDQLLHSRESRLNSWLNAG